MLRTLVNYTTLRALRTTLFGVGCTSLLSMCLCVYMHAVSMCVCVVCKRTTRDLELHLATIAFGDGGSSG